VVRATAGHSAVHRLRSAGPLRLLAPRAAGRAAWIVASSLGGGLVDGDDVALEVAIDAGATAVITTQSSSKIYRGRARQQLAVRVLGDAVAIVVPDPVAPFRGAQLEQITEVALDAEGSLVLSDAITAGRIAHGERWSAPRIDARLALSRAGAPLLVDRLLLDAAGGDVAARLGRFVAIGTAIVLGPRVADAAAAILATIGREPVTRGADLVRAASPLGAGPGGVGCIVRLAGTGIEQVTAALRELLEPACLAAGERPWARRW
jgi:urease accessory protein